MTFRNPQKYHDSSAWGAYNNTEELLCPSMHRTDRKMIQNSRSMRCVLPLLRDEPKLCLVINSVGINPIQSEDDPISLFQFWYMDPEDPDQTTAPWIFLDMV